MQPTEAIHAAICNNDAVLFRETLARNPELKRRINEPIGNFNSPLVFSARSREMLDAFLEAGADLNARSKWWAGGFGFLDNASEELAEYALLRGARLDVHSAARLGKAEALRQMLSANPKLVEAQGGDGKTPLHFARNTEIAKLLVENGANINARDVDHESTPVQYHIEERPEVVRYLVSLGCETDIFLASALGDNALAERHLKANPNCVRMRVNREDFPMRNLHAGGTIYQWTLGFNLSPHETALKFNHPDTFELLMARSPTEVQMLVHCWTGNERAVEDLLTNGKLAMNQLTRAELRQLPDAARNNNFAAVRLLSKAGLPLTSRGQHDGMALHWAAWHGNLAMTQALIAAGAPLEDEQNEFKCSPLAWAVHGSQNGWHRETGNYAATAEALIAAGARIPDRKDGTDEVRQVLQLHR